MIWIHTSYYKYTKKGAAVKVKDVMTAAGSVDKDLGGLRNFDQLPKLLTINNISVDVDLNKWFQCGGYGPSSGLYLLEYHTDGRITDALADQRADFHQKMKEREKYDRYYGKNI